MMAHNLCYSTLLAKDDVKLYPPESVEKTPGEGAWSGVSPIRVDLCCQPL